MNISAKITPFLEKLGLNHAEIICFLSALEAGSGSASTIAKMANLNRITAYEALKRLSKKGFIKIRAKKNSSTKYFVAASHEELIEKLKKSKQELENSISEAQSLKADFEARFSEKNAKPIVLYYEGLEGIQDVLEDTLREKPLEILSFAAADPLQATFSLEYLDMYWKRRVSLGITTRGILPETQKALQNFSIEKNEQELRTLKFISGSKYNFTNEIDIYGDNVGIISLEKGNPHGVIIRSKSIADSLRSIFETLWT